jgi:hypothetical protein
MRLVPRAEQGTASGMLASARDFGMVRAISSVFKANEAGLNPPHWDDIFGFTSNTYPES